jgi:ATP-binding cassette subfamily F protein uup
MSILLSAEKISKKLGEKVLFSQLSFGIHKHDRIGLIAPNGSGKSTLMHILNGDMEPDTGILSLRAGTRVAFLPQQPTFVPGTGVPENVIPPETPMGQAVITYLNALKNEDKDLLTKAYELMDDTRAWDFENTAEQIMSRLDISGLHQPMEQLSGGQRRRVALARLLLSDADILLMDEPTNHLDTDMIQWLEKYLTQQHKTLFLVTHDRYFLDRVCNKIMELDQMQWYTYEGDYAYFLEKRQERYDARKSELHKAQNLFHKELEWVRRQPKARGTKSKARLNDFETLKDITRNKISERALHLASGMKRLGKKIIEAHNISLSYYGKTPLFENFTYHMIPGERLGIIGKNGIGKSSLIKVLTKEIPPDNGTVSHGETIQIGYFGQEVRTFKEGQRVMEALLEIADHFEDGQHQTLSPSQLLERFLFSSSQHFTPIEKLSGGEKRRLQLLLTLVGNPNVLILDEPTNDLDLLTIQVLEDFLEQFAGNIIVVSHDRHFMDKIVDHVWVMREGQPLMDFPGNYSQYKEYEHQLISSPPSSNPSPNQKKTTINTPAGQGKMTYKEQKELEDLPNKIAEMETKRNDIMRQLSEVHDQYDKISALSDALKVIQSQLDAMEERWMLLTEKSEGLST